MSIVQFRNKRVGVEKLKKQSKKDDDLFYKQLETDEFLGVIRFVGPEVSEDLQLGDTVYFSNQFQLVKMVGFDICVMEDSNILAKVI